MQSLMTDERLPGSAAQIEVLRPAQLQ